MKSRTIYLLRCLACTLLSLVLVTLPLLGIASERQHLKGYSDFSFGMAEAEVRQRITVLSEKSDSISDYDQLLLLEAAGEVDIGGLSFRRALGIKDGQLVLIQLRNEETNPHGGCDARFDRAYGLIQAKYGDSDAGIEREDFMGLSKVSSAKFTFADSSKITLGGVWTGKSMNDGVEKCELLATYEAPKGYGQF